jgi:hypothetical protein
MLPARARASKAASSAAQRTKPSGNVALTQDVDLLLGKIQRRLDAHAQLDQPLDQRMHFAREFARQRAHCRTGGRRGLRLDQVGHRFRLNQIDLVVEVGPTRKLARIGQARTELQATRQQHLHHHRTAVTL